MRSQVLATVSSSVLPPAALEAVVRAAIQNAVGRTEQLQIQRVPTRPTFLLDRGNSTVSTPYARLSLSRRQSLLLHLLTSERRVWATEELRAALGTGAERSTVRVLVYRTRRVIGQEPIETVLDEGYRWNPDYELVEV